MAPRSRKTRRLFPLVHMHKIFCKENYAECVSLGALVFISAVLESVVTDVFEMAGEAAVKNKKGYISHNHLPFR